MGAARAQHVHELLGGDPGFFRYLVSQDGSTSDIGGVLAQYMDTSGQNSQNQFSFAGSFQIDPSVGATPPANVQDSAIQSELTNDIGSGTLPAPSGTGMGTIYVVLFPPNDDVCFPGNCAYDSDAGFCGYHSSFELPGSSTQILYAAIPDNGRGTPNYGFCGPSFNDLANQTSVVSHEVSETINDPLVAEAPGWGPPLSWYDPTYDGEVADKCDAEPLAANGPWMVEELWSNLDQNCEPGESAFSAPTASFLAPSSGAAEQQLSFDASASTDPPRNHISALEQGVGRTFSISSGIAGYRWNWGDQTPDAHGSAATATHTFSAPGTYEVSLTVTDSLGFTSTVTHQVTVTAKTAGSPEAITGAATEVDGEDATLNGRVNPESQTVSYRFVYGTDPGSLTQSTPTAPGPPGQTATAVSAALSGLQPSTTYYYQLQVTVSGQTYTGAVQSFITDSSPGAPQTPVVATGSAARVGASGALLTGTINPDGASPVDYVFVYGTSPSRLDQTTPSSTQPGRTTAAPVTATLTGLNQTTTYYYRLDATLDGQTYSGPVQTFNTSTAAPSATTGAASGAGGQHVMVSGRVDPDGVSTTYLVEFGTTKAYGYSSKATGAGSGRFTVPVRVALDGLRPRTRYHYRLVATSKGGTAVGSDRAFTTGQAPGQAPSFSFRAPGRLSLRRLLSHHLRVRFRCSKACTARFTLTVAPADLSQGRTVPLVIARGTARLRSRGSAVATLEFVRAGRRHTRRLKATRRRLKLSLLGYAVGPGSSPSRPEQVRIWLN